MSFDTDLELERWLQDRDDEIEAAERALHTPIDDDRGRRCVVCGDPTGIRCCEFGADR